VASLSKNSTTGEHTFDGGLFGGLGTEVHTVPKSELEAVIQAM
jgi:hypothetical protein